MELASVGTVVPSICLTEARTVAQYRAVDGLLERLVAVIRVASPRSCSPLLCFPRSCSPLFMVARSATGSVQPAGVGHSGGFSSWAVVAGALAQGSALRFLRRAASAATRRVTLRRHALRGAGPRGTGGRLCRFAYGTLHQVARHGRQCVETPSYISQKNAFTARSGVTSRGARPPIAINYLSASASSRSGDSFCYLAGPSARYCPAGPGARSCSPAGPGARSCSPAGLNARSGEH
jgi:hypothetical protein